MMIIWIFLRFRALIILRREEGRGEFTKSFWDPALEECKQIKERDLDSLYDNQYKEKGKRICESLNQKYI